MRNWRLLAAGVLLIATALFHLTGTSMVGGWFDDDRSTLVVLLWVSASVVWGIVALTWLYHCFAKREPGWPLLLCTAAIPAVTGVPLLVVSRGAHPGAYMLLASSALALWSGTRTAK